MSTIVHAIALTREIALEYGESITDDEASYILWNETGWPCFWPRNNRPNIALRVQLREFFIRRA